MKPIALLSMTLLVCGCFVGNAVSQTAPVFPGDSTIASSNSIKRPVEIGDRLSILTVNGVEYSGRLQSTANDTLIIEERGKVIRSLSRSEVHEISLYKTGQARAILVGAAIGSLAGLLVAAVVGSPVNNPDELIRLLEGNEGKDYYSICIPIGAVLGGLLGASSPVRVSTWYRDGFWSDGPNSGQACAPRGLMNFSLTLNF